MRRDLESLARGGPNLPWVEIVAMRNRLIHAYFDVNLDVVWQTIHYDLPPLIKTLEDALRESPD